VILAKAEHEKRDLKKNIRRSSRRSRAGRDARIAAKSGRVPGGACSRPSGLPENRVANAKAMPRRSQRGVRIVFPAAPRANIVPRRPRAKKITGKDAEAGARPRAYHRQQERDSNDPEKPFVTSGIRIGSPAMTTRGFKEAKRGRSRTSSPTCSKRHPTLSRWRKSGAPSTRSARISRVWPGDARDLGISQPVLEAG